MLSYGLSTVLQNHRDGSERLVYVILALVCALFFVIGVVFGILAMALARSGQRGSVFARALGGLALFGLLAVIAVPNFVRARTKALQNREALHDVQAASADLRARTVASLNSSDKGRSVDLRPLQDTLNRAAAKSSGDNAAILKGSAAFAQELQTLVATYEKASRELIAAKVLTTRTLVRQEQIQERKALVEEFLKANEACKNYVAEGESHYRKALAGFQISADQREAAVAGFRKSWAAQSPVVLQIRGADERMGQATLAALDLLDTGWGHWSYDEGRDMVRFEQSADVVQYNDLLAKIRQAATDQTAAQKRLAAAMSKAAAPAL